MGGSNETPESECLRRGKWCRTLIIHPNRLHDEREGALIMYGPETGVKECLLGEIIFTHACHAFTRLN